MKLLYVWLASLLVSGLVGAASAPVAGPQPEELDEVQVTAQRLFEMRQKVVAAEDRFYALYNELNTRDEFDIVCRQERRTGSNLVRRVCVPKAADQANNDEMVGWLDAQLAGTPDRPRADPAPLVMARKSAEYRENMLALLKKNPRLRSLVREQEQLQKRYDEEKRRRMNGKLVILD